MFRGFKGFILRGNVIELAVAVVIGAAFTAVVNSIVANLINPLIGVIFQADSLDSALVLEIPTLRGDVAEVRFGAVLGAVIAFVIVATVVYFVFVLPMNTFKAHVEARKGTPAEEPEEEPAAATEAELLVEIRDLLKAQRGA